MEKKLQNKRSQSVNNANKKKEKTSNTGSVKATNKRKVNPKLKMIINRISIGTMFILGLVSFYLIYRILVLNMIPMKYFIVILLVIFAILSIMALLLINRKIKWKIKVGGIVFSLITVIGMFFVSRYIETTISFLNKITGNNLETSVYYLVTLKDSKIQNISDVKSEIGYVSTIANINEAIDELNKDNDFKYKDYKQITDLKDDLLDKKIDVALIADYHMQPNEYNDDNFSEKVKKIHTINITKEKENKSKTVDVTKDPFNVYISGIDTYGEIGTVARSDVNIIASINPVTKQILLTTIPRDYYVTLHGYGEKDKLTHAGVFGIDTSVGTLEDLLDIDINYYVRVNFSTLEDIVNALDGIDVYSEVAFTGYNGKYFQKGYNHLDGQNALVFARVRKAFIQGDRQRGRNQQAVIKAIINKAISPSIISNYSDLLKSLQGTFQTNMSPSEIQKLAKFQIDKMPSWDILNLSLNGSDASKSTYLYGNTLLYVMVPYQDSVDYAKGKIKDLLSGKKIEVMEERASAVVQYSPSTSKPNNDKKQEENNNTEDNKPTTDDKKPSGEVKPDDNNNPEDNNVFEDNQKPDTTEHNDNNSDENKPDETVKPNDNNEPEENTGNEDNNSSTSNSENNTVPDNSNTNEVEQNESEEKPNDSNNSEIQSNTDANNNLENTAPSE